MKTLIVGCGALGGYYGAMLSHAGARPAFLVRETSEKFLQDKGILVECPDGVLKVFPEVVTSNVALLDSPDLVIVTTKLYDLSNVCLSLARVVKPETIFITLQNGISAREIICQAIPNAHVLPATTFVIARRQSSGHIIHSESDASIHIGALSALDIPGLEKVAAFLPTVQIPIICSEDIEKDLWIKFIWFSAYAGIAGVHRVSLGEIARREELRTMLFSALEEGIAVARAEKIKIPTDLLQQYQERLLRTVALTPETKPSLLRDVEEGKQTEIDYLSGKIVFLATQHHLLALTHQMLWAGLKRGL